MTRHDRISTPFDRDSTAFEVIAGVDLSGKRAIVTGGSSGIGVETARALASAGAQVTLAVRNTEAGERTAADIASTTGNPEVFVERLELTDRATVRAFAAAWNGPLDILVNNAAAMALPTLKRTERGWEMQFATNHLGHFELTQGLHDALAAAGAARIVSVSSSAHLMSPVDFEDIHFENRDYDTWLGYGQSKTANVLFAVEASRRWAGDGITANALMPGGVKTKEQGNQEEDPDMDPAIREAMRSYQWKTTQQGAATSLLLAVSPLLEGVGGRYFEDCNEAIVVVPPANSGVADYALDPVAAARLWDVSIEMLNG
jgi:NAD(P)-dependent dehydrogenase (short-subunit alcohol dehydrogenase family)